MKVFSGHIVDVLNRRIFDGRIQTEGNISYAYPNCFKAKNIVRVVNEVIRMKGGIAAVGAGGRSAGLELPIAGLMSPLITMSFMCVPVIPRLKITDKGIFDAVSFSFKSIDS